MALPSTVSRSHIVDKIPPDKRRKYFNPAQAAEYLGVSTDSLARWRMERRGPGFSKLNGFLIRYSMDDLEAFANAGRFSPQIEMNENQK